MRWHYRDAALLWLFPPAYLAHLAEEWWGGAGFPVWVAAIAGRPLPPAAFLGINAVAFVLLLAGLRAASRHESAGWIAIAVGTIVSVNALLHVAGTVLTRTYSPGLITAVVLYFPLGHLLLIRAAHQVDAVRVAQGIAAGVAIHTVVILVAAMLTRWPR